MDGIIETLQHLGETTIFIKLMALTKLEEKLNTEGPFTIFAPNDEAFSELPAEIFQELTANLESLREILFYHIVPGELMSEELIANPVITTLEGEDLLVEILDDTLEVNDAAIITPDVPYFNGWIHVIDAVLMP